MAKADSGAGRAALVTGATSYTGSFVAQELLARGWSVRSMTNHPRHPGPWADRLEVHPYSFHDAAALRRTLAGVNVLVNTYWIRFPRNGLDYDDAVENIRILMEAAVDVGVERVVHVSVSNPSVDSPFPYYRGKAQAEGIVRATGLPYAIARPTWVIDESDILLNNVAWLLRRLPVFGMPGNGRYRVQPVTGADAGRVLADFAEAKGSFTRDLAGPETLSFGEVVRGTKKAMGKHRLVVPTPGWLAALAAHVLSPFVRDVVLTRYELDGLRAEKFVSAEPPLGTTGFSAWVAEHGKHLGRAYHSELERHFRGVDPGPFRRH